MRPEIKAALERFVLTRLFTDGDGPIYEQQQRMQEHRFHTVALPLTAARRCGPRSGVRSGPGVEKGRNALRGSDCDRVGT